MAFSKSILVFCVLIGSISGFSQTHVWNGNGGNNDWFNSNNWDILSVPNASSDVQIPDNFNVSIISAPAMINTLTLGLNTNLDIENNISISEEIHIPSNANILWKKGVLSGGRIEIDGTLNIEAFETKDFSDIIINNRGQIFITDSNQIHLFNATTINNAISGEILINSNGGLLDQSSSATVNNYGLIHKVASSTNGSFYMIFDMNNYGILDIGENQTFLFLIDSRIFNNFDDGIMRGDGVFDITSTFSNTGTISPGNNGAIGNLIISNVFSLTSPGKLNIDIAGSNPGEYDTVHVFGGPDLQGTIDINLTFEPIVNDEFTIITSVFKIPSCDFPSQVSVVFGDSLYTFDIICNLNSVVLRLNNVTLHTEVFDLKSLQFFVAPNPIVDDSKFVFPENLELNQTTISIYNYLGQKIKTVLTSNEGSYLNTFNLSSGLYIVKLENKEGILATTKFIVP